MRFTFIIFFIFIAFTFVKAEDKGIISGKITSSKTMKPLQYVNIRVEGTKLGAVSNQDGYFTIKNLPTGVYAVKFSLIGYESYTQSNVIVNSVKPAQVNIELMEKLITTEETVVRADYFIKNVETISSSQMLSAEEIRRTPGTQEDVVRATALLPGVAVTGAGRNDLLVRGGSPFENLFVVDNIEVPNINHFGTQGTSGGPLSIINIDFVKNVDFSAGAFGAKYGDKTSSITNITLRNGNEEKFGGKVVLSATGFGVNFEGPVADGSSFFFSARRSYLDLIFKAAGFGFIPEYWDFQGKLNYKINDLNYISFLGIGAIGSVKLNNDTEDKIYDNSRVTVPNQKQYFSGITWKHLFENGFLTATLGETYTNFDIYQNDNSPIPQKVFYNKSKESETSLKTDLDIQLSPTFGLLIGNQVKWATSLDYNISIPGYLRVDNLGVEQPLVIDTAFRAYKNASYVSIASSFGQFKFNTGIRLDYYNFIKDKWYISPRASLLYQLNQMFAFTLSAGRYYQSPSYIWLIGDKNNHINLTPIQSDQIVLGFEHRPLEDVKVQIEGFYKKYSNYPARIFRPASVLSPSGFEDITSDIPYGLEPLINEGSGYSRGIELFIQKKLSQIPLYGLFSLSLSETKFKSIDQIERYGTYDTRVVLNLALGYRIDENWELSSKFRFSTAPPATDYLSTGKKDYENYNAGERYSAYHSMDFRVDRRWDLGNYYLVTYIDIQNIYNRKNISGVRWDYQNSQPEYNSSFGILPSIGISFEF